MEKLYITEWHNIKFKDFINMDNKKIADNEFYNKFYEIFFTKYGSFDDLDEKWKESRKNSIEFILSNIKGTKKVLSIGCGIGYLEHKIARKYNGELIAIEPSNKALKWIEKSNDIKVFSGFFPQDMPKDILADDIDLAYIASIDYVFTNDEYKEFLESIILFGIKKLLIVDVGIIVEEHKNMFHLFKSFVKKVLIVFGIEKYKRNYGQFIGYRRNFKEQYNIVKSAGFDEIEYGYFNDNIPFIKAIKK